ncbi:MAG: TolC family protein [Candidatus Eisenbacteria bacterium]|nr:TolC family protein [Candidatus Eisenbacteria bacterium]
MSWIMASCLLASMLLVSPLHAQRSAPADALTRARVVELAMERAPDVLDADARLLESHGRLRGARILTGNPVVDVVTGGSGGGGNRTEVEISVPVGFGLKRARRIGVANAELQRDERLAEDARRLAVGAALNAYYRVLHVTSRLGVARERLVLAERLRSAIGDRFTSGDVARLDLNVAETEVSRARSDVFVEQQGIAEARAGLALVLGLPSMTDRDVVGDLAERPALEEFRNDSELTERPDIQAAASQLKAAGAEHSLAGMAALPDLAFRLNYQRAGDDSEWLPGFAVTVPVFDRGQGIRTETRARTHRARLELERRTAAASAEQEAATAAYTAAVASVEELEKNALPRALEIESMSEESYLSGKSNLGAMLVLRRETLETRLDYVDRLLEAALRGVDVGLAIGMWPQERK